jgi:two-component system, LytTR family, sensor kinase
MEWPARKLQRIVVSFGIAFGVWMSIALLTIIQQYVNHLKSPLDVPLAAAVAAGFAAIALVTPPVFYLGRRFPVTRDTAKRVVVYTVGVVPFVIAYACVRWVIAPPYNADLHRFLDRSWTNFLVMSYANFAGCTWIYLEILLTANALEIYDRARTEALERAGLEQALATSELQALKVQLHPHFLFNTLHGIATLAETDGRRAKAMVVQLSALLRSALEYGSTDVGLLGEELRFVAAYLDLEKMRLGPRLAVRWSVVEDTREALVPHLILQPLVENAIVHGVACAREGGWVEISAERAGQRLSLRVRNSVAGAKTRGTGLGIKNTEARLKYLYSSDASISFSLNEAQDIAEAAVTIPFLGAGFGGPTGSGTMAKEVDNASVDRR